MNKLFKGIEKLASVLGCMALAGMLICISANVIMRFFFGSGLIWAEEYSYLFFCYASFLGSVIIYDSKEIISINAVLILLPKSIQNACFYIKRGFMVLANIFLTYLTIQFSIQGAAKFSAMMRIPYAIIDASIAVMFFLNSILSIRDFIYAVKKKDVMETERRSE